MADFHRGGGFPQVQRTFAADVYRWTLGVDAGNGAGEQQVQSGSLTLTSR
ncbi:hypothetical protein [Streptomyces sp. A012304]|nr:hypothetical protein [Streptomyces sp. A012304]GKQ34066.1 hypothetical protein ALMP_06170 [Streptomyces sp. A012304]